MAAAATDDREMKDLMSRWDTENNYQDVSDGEESCELEPTGYDDMLEKYRRTVHATDNTIDHVVLGTSNLEKAMDVFEDETGVRPLMVVSHNGLGTKSARVAFNQCAFLEIIAPDPAQAATPLAKQLAALPADQLVPVHYAIRKFNSKDLKQTVWKDMNFTCDEVTMVATDKGMPWKWDMFFLEGHNEGGLLPFFIHWGDSHHAAGRLPIVGDLERVVITTSNSQVKELLAGVDGVDVANGDSHFELSFTCPDGRKTYSGSSLIGITFPKN
jgi:Glyoxalase-like domain